MVDAVRPKRSDASRNKSVLLEAAATVFVRSGVEATAALEAQAAPIARIASK